MTDDLVKRLREGPCLDSIDTYEMTQEAADEIERLKEEQKRLARGSVEYFNKLYARHKEEIERLKTKCDMQAMILRRLTPENYPDTLFIHGTLGEKDDNGMPEKLSVVPAYGVDFSYIYKRTDKITGPEW